MGKIIKIHDKKFKSIYFSYNFTLKINKEEIAKYVISCFALSKGSKNYGTSKVIETYLSSLYGANFHISVEKVGDLFNFEFKIECVNKNYLPNKEDVLKKSIEFIYDIIYNPKISDGTFDNDIFEREKQYIISCIEKRKDEKIKYAISRAEEIMIKDSVAGSYIYGDIQSAKIVKNTDCVEAYKELISKALVTIIISGNLEGYDNIENDINNIFNDKMENLCDKEGLLSHLNEKNRYLSELEEIKEKMDTVQSVICLGMKNELETDEDFYIANVYNNILGGTPSSKLFQNVREKESLAYTTRSRYYRFKKIFIIYAGIEEKNYDKAKQVILKQVEDMADGNITDVELNTAKESLVSDLKEWKDSKVALGKSEYLNLINNKKITIEEIIENIQKVSKNQIVEYSKNIDIKMVYLLGGAMDE